LFGLSRKKSGKGASALAGQRLKRRRSVAEPKGFSKVPLAAGFAVALAALFSLWYAGAKIQGIYQRVTQVLASKLFLEPRNWDVQITDLEGAPHLDDLRKDIFRVTSSHLDTGSPADLDALSDSVLALGCWEQVSVIRPRYQTIVISAALRKPVLLVQVGSHTRFLARDGVVYGDATETTSNSIMQVPQVVVTGVFDSHNGPFLFDKAKKLVVTVAEQELLSAALRLSELASKGGLGLKSISYQGYRGLGITLEDETEVLMGSLPFEYKLEKLASILGKLKAKGTTASRIELDYDGKAFIKEKKL
jgi:hypothetical protein